ncbi:MAG: prolyl oligopeptidase family serine peptidase [Terrimonas sp.]|nr:prolyl oligopeptidase family serine peptidase [Terrimonas sp.]
MNKYAPLLFLLLSCWVKTGNIMVTPGIYAGTIVHGNFSGNIEIELIKDTVAWRGYYTHYAENAIHIPFQELMVKDDTVRCLLKGDTYTLDFRCHYEKNEVSLVGQLRVDSITVPFRLMNKAQEKNPVFTQEAVEFNSNNNIIYGSIWKPGHPNGHAIIVLTSSGNWDRNASSGLCQYFALNGYTSFHYDKRGTGNTKGNWVNTGMDTLVQDDQNAIRFFAEHTGIPLSQTGITGSSQGATKIPEILNSISELPYGIMVSCPGSSLLESDLNFWKNRNLPSIPSDEQAAAISLQRKAFMAYAGQIPYRELKQAFEENQDKTWFPLLEYAGENDGTDSKLLYSPLTFLEKCSRPLLIIQGLDDEIIPSNSMEIIVSAVKKAGNTQYDLIKFPETNHAMQYTGPSDFPYMRQLQPAYLPAMLDWIKKLK